MSDRDSYLTLPPWITLLGYAGLVPFMAAPAWMTFAGESAPLWLDKVWLSYVTLIAAFLAGSFWGYAILVASGPDGRIGVLIASALMLLTWISMWLPTDLALLGLSAIFLLLLLADFWRRRALDDIPAYFQLRAVLTIGVLIAIAWRLLL
jgi:hypothetical protein